MPAMPVQTRIARWPDGLVSDSARDEVVARLSHAYVEGHLDLSDFRDLLDSVFAAQRNVDLESVVQALLALPAPTGQEDEQSVVMTTRGAASNQARLEVVARLDGIKNRHVRDHAYMELVRRAIRSSDIEQAQFYLGKVHSRYVRRHGYRWLVRHGRLAPEAFSYR